jgi:hypothetical protein
MNQVIDLPNAFESEQKTRNGGANPTPINQSYVPESTGNIFIAAFSTAKRTAPPVHMQDVVRSTSPVVTKSQRQSPKYSKYFHIRSVNELTLPLTKSHNSSTLGEGGQFDAQWDYDRRAARLNLQTGGEHLL